MSIVLGSPQSRLTARNIAPNYSGCIEVSHETGSLGVALSGGACETGRECSRARKRIVSRFLAPPSRERRRRYWLIGDFGNWLGLIHVLRLQVNLCQNILAVGETVERKAKFGANAAHPHIFRHDFGHNALNAFVAGNF